MTDTILTHDSPVSAFEDAGGVVSTDDDGVSFSWDEEHVVRVDAPADLKGAFDTERFYKIEGATVARPIKQPYMVGDEIEWHKKPAEELRNAAWTFDNAPFTLGHPDTGMVKDVDDVHGFWRNSRYDSAEDRMKEDLYVPVNDDEALAWIEENKDVSVGFYNRVYDAYDGDTGDLTDDDVDGFQVDIFGNHIAGVEQGRCSGEDGCGLDSQRHGELLDPSVQTRGTTDAPSGIYVAEDGTWLAVGPNEHPDDSTEHPDGGKFPVDSCSDIEDAWGLRGHTDGIDIDKSTLENRIERVDDAKGCGVVGDETTDDSPESTEDCGCTNTMSDNGDSTDGFDIPDLSVDAIVEQNDAVKELKAERDELSEAVDEMDATLREAFDSAEHFSVELDDDECPCEAVEDLVADLDEKATEVEDLQDELAEYREDEREDALDRLAELGADRAEWDEEDLDDIEEEIDRREEVIDATDDATVKDIDSSTDEDTTDADETTMSGTRRFGRGHKA